MVKLSSGEIAPKTGTYKVVSGRGRVVGTVQIKRGSKMPPTQSPDCHFELTE